jgi:hypothetical protein
MANMESEKKKVVASVVELNEDEAERLRANSRLYFLVDQQGFRKEGKEEGLEEGWKAAEAKYRPVIEAKDRELEALRQKLREAGID